MPDFIPMRFWRIFIPRFSPAKPVPIRCVPGLLGLLSLCLLTGNSGWANVPGGGTNGAAVTIVDNGTTVTMSNGIVAIVITKTSAQINTINYTFNNTGSSRTLNLLSGGNGGTGGYLYWFQNSGTFIAGPFAESVVTNTGDYAEISLSYASPTNGILDIHYSMQRGSPGFYTTAIVTHRSSDGIMHIELRPNIYAGSMFNWMSVDAARNRLMEVSGGSSLAVNGAPKECYLWTNGIYAGQYEDKYKYSADLDNLPAWGWSSVGTGGYNVGIWNVSASHEYYPGGPMLRQLMEHIGTTILNVFTGNYYGLATDSGLNPGETWSHVYGPYLYYCNCVTNTLTGTNAPAQALYHDALAQGAAEQTAWPYSWFNNTNYPPASGRGTVNGKMVIADSGNPNASVANLWVGLVQQPDTNYDSVYDFQQWMKPCQFWTKTDTNGNFTVPNVIAGTNYTLYAFGPGAEGTFQSQSLNGGNPPILYNVPTNSFSVTVPANGTNSLGTVTWKPTRVGATVFEIGYPDRTAAKFRHGDDYWVGDIGPSSSAPSPIWSKWLEYPLDFPNGVNYTVGQSRWTTDWNFCQPVVTDSSGNYNTSSSTITFNLATAPTNGASASLYLGLCSDYDAAIIVTVNGVNAASLGSLAASPTTSIPSTGYYVSYGDSDTSIREGNNGAFTDERLTFSATALHAGANTLTIGFRQIGGSYFANHFMYDYVRLELTGYVPPPPASVAAYAGNGCNLICWPVTPGATRYNLLRSTTSGGGYVALTNGVTGPVCGSGTNNAVWLDATAVNGTTYYYVVQSVNPTGTSTNSPQSSGVTPLASLAAAAPAAPTGLTVVTSGHHSVTLGWTAVTNANFYSVWRSTLVNNGGGASNLLSTIILNNTNTGTTCTDPTPTDGSIYSYSVTATGPGGTSSNSTPVAARPLPAAPATAPVSLTGSFSSTNITLNWAAVPGAIGYVISRATNAAGPFTFLMSITETTYTDYGLNANLTYYYKIVAVNTGGISAATTNSVNFQQPAPTSLTAIGTNAQVMLSWSAATNATSYTLWRGTNGGKETVAVVSAYTGTTYTNTGLVNGTTYYYLVTATGTGGTSGYSPEASATPDATGNGTWTANASGVWSTGANWSSNQIAFGPGYTADFSTLALASNLTVTLDTDRTLSGLKFGDVSASYNWTLAGTNTLTLAGTSPGFNVLNQTATVSSVIAGTAGLTKNGGGQLTLGGATESFTGGMTLNAGTLNLDFSASGSPTTTLVPPQALNTAGGSLTLTGNVSTAASQSLGATTFSNGLANVTLTPGSGGSASLTLASVTRPSNNTLNGGAVRFSTTGTATISGTTSSTLLVDNQGNPYATYGTEDYAGTDASGNVMAATLEENINANVTWGTSHTSAGPLKFSNTSSALQLTLRSGATYTIPGGYLMVAGSQNVTIQGTGTAWIRPYKNAGAYGSDVTVFQNSTAGDMIWGSSFNIPNGGASGAAFNLVKCGVGRLITGTTEGYSKVFLNEGTLQVVQDGQMGITSGTTVEFYGGTLEAAATATFSTHPFNLNAPSGLSVLAGCTATFNNVFAGAGSLTLGGVSGDTGTAVLTNANTYTGGTVLQSGTLNINGIYALGGANYGGLTFNGGTLQYATNFSGNGSGDLTSMGTAGVTLASGGGTIDLNGNAVTCAGSIGNGGSGALLIESSLAGGVLTLPGSNTYTGNTLVSNATLLVSNPAGSATGAGDVTVQNNGVLTGAGARDGSVTGAAGGRLAPGNPRGALSIGGNLTLAAGSQTRMQVQHAPLTNDVVTIAGTVTAGGSLVVTNSGGALASGDRFPLFNAASYSGSFSNISLPTLNAGLFWSTSRLMVDGTLGVVSSNSPAINRVSLSGDSLVLQGTNGTPNWAYAVLSSTNLILPLAQWTVTGTNSFDASGNFNWTNAASADGSRQFYLIRVQ